MEIDQLYQISQNCLAKIDALADSIRMNHDALSQKVAEQGERGLNAINDMKLAVQKNQSEIDKNKVEVDYIKGKIKRLDAQVESLDVAHTGFAAVKRLLVWGLPILLAALFAIYDYIRS